MFFGLPNYNLFKKKKSDSNFGTKNLTSEAIQIPILSFSILKNSSQSACLKANLSIGFQIDYFTLQVNFFIFQKILK